MPEGFLFSTLLQHATPVALIAFLFYIYWQLFKRIEKLEAKFDELEKHIGAKFEAIDREYLTREQYYRDWGGFRGELERVSTELHKTTLNLERLIGKMEGQK